VSNLQLAVWAVLLHCQLLLLVVLVVLVVLLVLVLVLVVLVVLVVPRDQLPPRPPPPLLSTSTYHLPACEAAL
jgi:hypothetical protein